MPVPFVSHPDVTCDSNAVPVNTQSRPVFSNPGDSSRSNDFDFSAIDDHPSGCAIILAKDDGAHLSALYRFPFCT